MIPYEWDQSFPHDYRVEVSALSDEELGLMVVVTPSAEGAGAWTKVFRSDLGQGGHRFVTGVYATPDPLAVCVVSSGDGGFISTRKPTSFVPVECIPIRFVLPFPRCGLLVFGNFTEFIAYEFRNEPADVRLGVKWRTARLGWDDLQIVGVKEDRIEGAAWHAPDERMVGFSVDLRTGEHEGGADEELEQVDVS